MPPRPVELTNRQKAAILLVALGPDASGKLYRHLPQEDIEQLVRCTLIGRPQPWVAHVFAISCKERRDRSLAPRTKRRGKLIMLIRCDPECTFQGSRCRIINGTH